MTKNGTVCYRVEQLEKNYCELDKKMDRILENELPHLAEQLTNLKTRINLLTTMNIGALLLVALLAYALKVI